MFIIVNMCAPLQSPITRLNRGALTPTIPYTFAFLSRQSVSPSAQQTAHIYMFAHSFWFSACRHVIHTISVSALTRSSSSPPLEGLFIDPLRVNEQQKLIVHTLLLLHKLEENNPVVSVFVCFYKIEEFLLPPDERGSHSSSVCYGINWNDKFPVLVPVLSCADPPTTWSRNRNASYIGMRFLPIYEDQQLVHDKSV